MHAMQIGEIRNSVSACWLERSGPSFSFPDILFCFVHLGWKNIEDNVGFMVPSCFWDDFEEYFAIFGTDGFTEKNHSITYSMFYLEKQKKIFMKL
jgi:hypothetical protein